MGINWSSNVNRTIICPLFVGKLRLTYFIKNQYFGSPETTFKTYLLLELSGKQEKFLFHTVTQKYIKEYNRIYLFYLFIP